jgi:hypothetical protein
MRKEYKLQQLEFVTSLENMKKLAAYAEDRDQDGHPKSPQKCYQL